MDKLLLCSDDVTRMIKEDLTPKQFFKASADSFAASSDDVDDEDSQENRSESSASLQNQ